MSTKSRVCTSTTSVVSSKSANCSDQASPLLSSPRLIIRLEYCNAILAGLPKTTIAPLQRAQNAAARLVAQLGPRDHVSNALLSVQQRITYKLCLLMHLVHNDRAPVYLADSVTAKANISRRTRLRSASSLRYQQPRTRLKLGERCFAFAGCLEQSAIIHSRTVQHRHFQTAP